MSRDDDGGKRGGGAGGDSPSHSGGASPSMDHAPDVLVLDIGTGSIKVGWGGEDAPRAVIPTLLLDHHGMSQSMGLTSPSGVGGGGGSGGGGQMDAHHMERSEYAVGHAALQALHHSRSSSSGGGSQPAPTLLRPVERGEIKDYDSMQKILDYIFKHELRVNPKDHPVMLTVSPLCSPESRLELAKLMFDVFAVPALCMANAAVLSLYSTGRTTGLVLELGEGMSYCVPVYEGFALRHAVLSIPVAGADVTKYLMRQLGERGFAFFLAEGAGGGGGSGGGSGGGGGGGASGGGVGSGNASQLGPQLDTVRDIKERLCRVKQSKFDYNIVPVIESNAATALAQAQQAYSTPLHSSTSAASVAFSPSASASALSARSSSSNASGGGAAAAAAAAPLDVDESSYELPDGQMIRLDEHCRFNTLEILFDPHRYAQAIGAPGLTGGSNQCYGIPPQQQPNGASGSGGSSSGGGLGSTASSASLLSGAAQPSTPSGGGGIGGSGSSGPPTPIGAQGFAGFSSFSSGGGGAGNHTGRSIGGGGAGGLGGGGGPSSIDLSTNDLEGVHLLVSRALGMVDAYLRKDLLRNIVLAGGSSMAKGFGERMRREIAQLVGEKEPSSNSNTQVLPEAAGTGGEGTSGGNGSGTDSPALNVICDSQRKYAAWIGASMYASLPTFGIIQITAEQYKRDESIVHKKFF